jgi:hypothetical protein
VTDAAVSIAFFDPERQLHGSARSGQTLLFRGSSAEAVAEGPELSREGEGLRAELAGRFALELEPVGEAVELSGVTARICRVRGEVDGTPIDCLGTAAETREPPEWDRLDALRSLSILAGEEHALLAIARRPRGAKGHGDELVTAKLFSEGELLTVEDARLSTVYDGEGRQRSAGLELWMPGEDFPRRASGSAIAGTSLELEGLEVHAAVFAWHLEGSEAIGSYELMVRTQAPAAA